MELKSTNQEKSIRDGKVSYTIRESYDNDESKTCRIRECENGYIISIEHSYYEGEGDKRDWKCKEKEYISKDNPLDKIAEPKKDKIDKNDSNAVADSINTFLSSMTNKILI
jgi:hypothetical protein